MLILRTSLALQVLLSFALPLAAQEGRENAHRNRPERGQGRPSETRKGPEGRARAPMNSPRESRPEQRSHNPGRDRAPRMDPRVDRLPVAPSNPRPGTRREQVQEGLPGARMTTPSPLQREPLPAYRPPQRSRQEAEHWQREGAWRRNAWEPRATWREHRASRWEAEHRSWTQRGGYGGYCIPEPQFRQYFGDRNTFRLRTRPVIYGGYPRFRHHGFWILIVDPWPEFWLDTWYLDDDLYIAFTLDGYYLYSRRHPGISLAVAITL